MTNVALEKKEGLAAEFEIARALVEQDIKMVNQQRTRAAAKFLLAGVLIGVGFTIMLTNTIFVDIPHVQTHLPLNNIGMGTALLGAAASFWSTLNCRKADAALENINETMQTLPSFPEKKTQAAVKGSALKSLTISC